MKYRSITVRNAMQCTKNAQFQIITLSSISFYANMEFAVNDRVFRAKTPAPQLLLDALTVPEQQLSK